MSRWLQSVNSLLEKLDDRVETTAAAAAEITRRRREERQQRRRRTTGPTTAPLSDHDDGDEYYDDDEDYDDDDDDEGEQWQSTDEEQGYDDEEEYEAEDLQTTNVNNNNQADDEEQQDDEEEEEEEIDLLTTTPTVSTPSIPLFDNSIMDAADIAGLEDAIHFSSIPATAAEHVAVKEEASLPAPVMEKESVIVTQPTNEKESTNLVMADEKTNAVVGVDEPATSPALPAPPSAVVPLVATKDLPPPPSKPVASATAITSVPTRTVPESKHPLLPAVVPSSVMSALDGSEHNDGGGEDDDEEEEEDTDDHKRPNLESTPASLNSVAAVNHPTNTTTATATTTTTTTTAAAASKKLKQDLRKSQAEARQLRQHVLRLNQQLETQETELQAQREELERAAERMERDRQRHDEEREDLLEEQEEELEQVKDHYEHVMAEQKEQYEQEIQALRLRLQDEETKRLQEGGDWTKELQDAIQREREALQRLAMIQNERSSLTSLVAKLETQQTTLEHKVESLSNALKTATERERHAEDQLDATLSLHSRQASQRQAREAELERTIAEMGAALSSAQQQVTEFQQHIQQQAAESAASQQLIDWKEQMELAVEELETARTQLQLEEQRVIALQQELQALAQERMEEAAQNQVQQRQHDRQVMELQSNVSRLEKTVQVLREQIHEHQQHQHQQQQQPPSDPGYQLESSNSSEQQIATLSEQLMRQQELLESHKSEVLTLKSRLQSAAERAEEAERRLAQTPIVPVAHSRNAVYQMEGGGYATLASTTASTGLRRRVKGGGGYRGGGNSSNSLRSALNWNSSNPTLAMTTVDALDGWMVDSLTILRYEPIARMGLFLYLVILHLWSFFLVLFHSHETVVHSDFGGFHIRGGGVFPPPSVGKP